MAKLGVRINGKRHSVAVVADDGSRIYARYLRGWNAKTFGAQDYDLHDDYAYALGAHHASEKVPPHCRSYVLSLVDCAATADAKVAVPVARRVA